MNNGGLIPARRACYTHSGFLNDLGVLRAKYRDRNLMYERPSEALVPGIVFEANKEDINAQSEVCIKNIGLFFNCFNSCRTSGLPTQLENIARISNKQVLIISLETRASRLTIRRQLMPLICKAKLTRKDRESSLPEDHNRIQSNKIRFLATVYYGNALNLA